MGNLNYEAIRGAALLIVGPIVILINFALRPIHSGDILDDPEPALQEVADSAIFVPGEIILFFCFFLVLWGLGALARSIAKQQSSMWAPMGFAAALVSTAVVVPISGMDAVGLKQVADLWAEAPPADKASLVHVAQAVDAITTGAFSLWVTGYFGITIILYGLAVANSEQYPTALGWVAVVLGLGSAALGLTLAMTMSPEAGVGFLFVLMALIWMAVTGVFLWRRGVVEENA